jgi:hypothetical protein
MSAAAWTLSPAQRDTLERTLDALLPPDGSFPLPSRTALIDEFILVRVPVGGSDPLPFPYIDAAGLRSVLDALGGESDIVGGLEALEYNDPTLFVALWRLAVYGYYSRPETIAAIQRDFKVAYHGAPLPLGYRDVLPSWDAVDPLQLPATPVGDYLTTENVPTWDISTLREEFERA